MKETSNYVGEKNTFMLFVNGGFTTITQRV